MTYICRDEISI